MGEKNNAFLKFFDDDRNILVVYSCLFGPVCIILFWYINRRLDLSGYPGGTLDIINWTASAVLVFTALLNAFFFTRMDGLVSHKHGAVIMFFIFILISASITGLILNFCWPWLRIVYSLVVVAVFIFAVFMGRIVIMEDQ
jgi:hypothetical protein